MSRLTTKGTCVFCSQAYDQSGITRHLKACKARKAAYEAPGQPGKPVRLLHLRVEGQHLPFYWMHIEIPAAATLQDLDRFLRKIWLECCGHLSMFRIGEYNYVSYVEDVYDYPEDRDMRVPLGDVLEPGAAFTHEYDFGTTTYLTLKVIEDRTGVPSGDDLVYIMARNEQPEILCSACGNSPATEVCAACIWDGSGWLCDDCAPDHECGEDMLLPVVNSPRVGMCAYMGEIEDYEGFDDFF